MSQSINAVRNGQELSDPVDAILLRFPGPVTLNASRKKWAAMLSIVIGGIAMAAFLLQVDRFQTLYYKSVFWSVILFCGLGIPIAVAMLLPGSSKLVLDGKGFEITKFFRTHRIFWRDASGFQVYSAPQLNPRVAGAVAFDDAKQNETAMARANVLAVGRNSGLPDTYGFYADDLAYLMNQWRERALT